jgi:hypothetical protein
VSCHFAAFAIEEIMDIRLKKSKKRLPVEETRAPVVEGVFPDGMEAHLSFGDDKSGAISFAKSPQAQGGLLCDIDRLSFWSRFWRGS